MKRAPPSTHRACIEVHHVVLGMAGDEDTVRIRVWTNSLHSKEHRDIFGGDSDDEVEQDVTNTATTEQVTETTESEAADKAVADDDDALPSIPRREVTEDMLASEPIPPKKKARRDDEDADDGKAQPEPVDGADEEEEAPLTGKALIRAQVNARIDAALKSGKRRTTRRRAAGEDDLELMADEEVSALRTEMILAADEDEEANRAKQPATSKLRLLPRVVSTLQKYVGV